MDIHFIFSITILILSVVIHEVAHGFAAYKQGDMTAYYQGRLSFNPARHLDPVGSFLVPAASYILGGFIIGWARPVPYNPYNLRNKRWGESLVALAGPVSNIAVAVVFGLLIRFAPLGETALMASGMIVFINIVLAVFNMIPVPPLDGSKILFSILPAGGYKIRAFLEQNALIFILLVVFFLWRLIIPVVEVLFSLITGLSFW